MNPEVKAKWIAALRSGQYKQGDSCLATDMCKANGELPTKPQNFCCLGVLTDLYIKEHGLEWEISPLYSPGDTEPKVNVEFGLDNQFSVTPDEVMNWAGFNMSNPTVPDEADVDEKLSDTTSLAALNDIGYPFSHIATVIEEYL